MREPIEDDLLPLSKPVVGISGRVYAELPVPKGTMVSLSAFGYNLYVIFIVWLLSHYCTRYSRCCSIAGTKMCGVRTLTSSDRSVGLK